MRRCVFCRVLQSACLVVTFSSSAAFAVSFADQVVAYTPGAGAGDYSNPSRALGAPDAITGENPSATPYFDGPTVLGPFNGAYQSDELVRVGEGGSLTLRLERFVNVSAGLEFGVIENVSLYDPSYPSGTTSSPAATFSEDSALVEVSKDGVNFVGLTGGAATNVLFNVPALYYTNAGPFDTAAPSSPLLADFGKPFAGSLASFDGKATYADVVATFDGSAGGTWLDASASGLDQIAYVRFSVPDDNDPATVNTLEIDSILTNSALLGSLVPEPATFVLTALPLSLLRRRR